MTAADASSNAINFNFKVFLYSFFYFCFRRLHVYFDHVTASCVMISIFLSDERCFDNLFHYSFSIEQRSTILATDSLVITAASYFNKSNTFKPSTGKYLNVGKFLEA